MKEELIKLWMEYREVSKDSRRVPSGEYFKPQFDDFIYWLKESPKDTNI